MLNVLKYSHIFVIVISLLILTNRYVTIVYTIPSCWVRWVLSWFQFIIYFLFLCRAISASVVMHSVSSQCLSFWPSWLVWHPVFISVLVQPDITFIFPVFIFKPLASIQDFRCTFFLCIFSLFSAIRWVSSAYGNLSAGLQWVMVLCL